MVFKKVFSPVYDQRAVWFNFLCFLKDRVIAAFIQIASIYVAFSYSICNAFCFLGGDARENPQSRQSQGHSEKDLKICPQHRRSEERRVGKSVDHGDRRVIK